MSLLQARDISLVYKDQDRDVFACRDISVIVEAGEFVGILGPSGSGKSSLLYLLSGLKNPTSGHVLFKDHALNEMDDSARARLRLQQFGFVFQQPYLLGYLSALENILAVAPTQQDRALELLRDLGLEQKQHRLPHELSGGERQRVCVARALVNQPKVIFADEPTAALDHTNGVQVVELLEKYRQGGALVMVTHDPTMLGSSARIIKINDGTLTY